MFLIHTGAEKLNYYPPIDNLLYIKNLSRCLSASDAAEKEFSVNKISKSYFSLLGLQKVSTNNKTCQS